MIPWLGDDPSVPFPPVHRAMVRPDGLLAAGGDLSVPRLLNAYENGIFPWFSDGQPILWWSPDPRCVLFCDRVYVARRLRRRMRAGEWRLTIDRAFDEVMQGCAAPRPDQPDTWITEAMLEAYRALHAAGHAHSMEVWLGDELAGGVYGVAIGRVFFAESMFHRVTDASKIALVALCRQLSRWGFPLVDCQIHTPHLERMGAEMISRQRFIALLRHTREPGPQHWRIDPPPDALLATG